MALYSEEYIEKEKLSTNGDFRIEEEFKKLKHDSEIEMICEGFGIIKIMDIDGECYLKMNDSSEKSYFELTGKRIKKDKLLSSLSITILLVLLVWAIVNLITWYFVSLYSTNKGSYTTENVFGVVNSLFSGLAFAGIIYTILLQRNELKLQRKELQLNREELRLTRNEFSSQNETLQLQRFENTFFQMLTLHHDIVAKLQQNGNFGRDVFIQASSVIHQAMRQKQRTSILKNNNSDGLGNYDIQQAFNDLKLIYSNTYISMESNLSHYFRNLYQIFKFIHNTNFISDFQKQHYSNLVRSQLSQGELYVIFYNSLTPELGNPKFLFLVSHYDLMQNFGRNLVRKLQFHEEIFDNLANKVIDKIDIINEKSPESIFPN